MKDVVLLLNIDDVDARLDAGWHRAGGCPLCNQGDRAAIERTVRELSEAMVAADGDVDTSENALELLRSNYHRRYVVV